MRWVIVDTVTGERIGRRMGKEDIRMKRWLFVIMRDGKEITREVFRLKSREDAVAMCTHITRCFPNIGCINVKCLE